MTEAHSPEAGSLCQEKDRANTKRRRYSTVWRGEETAKSTLNQGGRAVEELPGPWNTIQQKQLSIYRVSYPGAPQPCVDQIQHPKLQVQSTAMCRPGAVEELPGPWNTSQQMQVIIFRVSYPEAHTLRMVVYIAVRRSRNAKLQSLVDSNVSTRRG